jgi:hypothetical protein
MSVRWVPLVPPTRPEKATTVTVLSFWSFLVDEDEPMDFKDRLLQLIRYNQLSTTENNRQKVSQVKKPQGQNEVEKQSVSPVADLQTGINKAAGGQTGGRETDGH